MKYILVEMPNEVTLDEIDILTDTLRALVKRAIPADLLEQTTIRFGALYTSI